MLEFIIMIIGAILTIVMINAAFRLGNRIAVATEASALHTAGLFRSLSPEAQIRASRSIDAELEAAHPRPRTSNVGRVDAASTF